MSNRMQGLLLILGVLVFTVVCNLGCGRKDEKPFGHPFNHLHSSRAGEKSTQPEKLFYSLHREEAEAIYAALGSRETTSPIAAGSSGHYAPKMAEHMTAHKADNGLYRYRTDTSGRTQYPDDPDWRTWATEEAEERGYADYEEARAKELYIIPFVFLPPVPSRQTGAPLNEAQKGILQRILEQEKQRALFRELNGIMMR